MESYEDLKRRKAYIIEKEKLKIETEAIRKIAVNFQSLTLSLRSQFNRYVNNDISLNDDEKRIRFRYVRELEYYLKDLAYIKTCFICGSKWDKKKKKCTFKQCHNFNV